MSKQEQTASGADVSDFPRGLNPNLTVAEIIDGYLVEYQTMRRPKDPSRAQRLGFWQAKVGDVPAVALTPEHIRTALRLLKQSEKMRFAGRDKGKPGPGRQ